MKAELLANLGDANPIKYGGFFVFQNRKNQNHCFVKALSPRYRDDGEISSWSVYEFDIPVCTYENGILSDNEHHKEFPAWFANDVDHIANAMGNDATEFIEFLTSEDPLIRSMAYKRIFTRWGGLNFDQYPVYFRTKEEVIAYFDGFVALK